VVTRMRSRTVAAACLVLLIAIDVPSAPAAKIVEHRGIGRSVRDRRLLARNVGARSDTKRLLVVGCIHGNECAGKRILRKLRRMPRSKNFELWMIGSLNPDGEAQGRRQNARGVDLNRNFPAGWSGGGQPGDTYYPGPRPHSEPETRAAMRFIKDLRPDVTIWYHQAMALVTKRNRHNRIPRLYAQRVGLPLRKLARLPGTTSRWQNKKFPGHVSFVVELPAGSLTNRSARRHARAVKAVARAW
jgi:murein peptide amidase A